jgi:Fuc2NAc and GlcNAc transferase
MSTTLFFFLAVVVIVISAISVRYLIYRYQQNGRIDVPNERSMHQNNTPTGAGIVMACFLSLTLAFFAISSFDLIAISACVIVVGLMLIGWLDDKNNLDINLRLGAFVLLAIVLVQGVGVITEVAFSDTVIIKLPYWLSLLLTMLAFIWLVNLYNFMDGMDGLAGLQAILTCIGFILLCFKESELSTLLIYSCSVLALSTLGFLIWNWHPAKIFMGDVGSLPIGGFFAIVSVCAVSYFDVSIFSCVLMIGVFVFDTTYTLFARLSRGENITQAHSSHIYQRLAKSDVSHHKIVIGYGALMTVFVCLALLFESRLISLGLAGVFAFIGVIFLLITARRLERSKSIG